MENKQVPFNYFYLIFQEKFRKKVFEFELNKIGDCANIINEIFDIDVATDISNNECINIYDEILHEVCCDYIALSNSSIDIFPSDSFEFVNLVLDTIEENPYKDSFLLSFKFIYQEYFISLGHGYPILMSCEDDTVQPSLKVTLNRQHQITQFESTNMNMIEQDKLLTKLLVMEKQHQIGPIPKVLVHIRNDI